MKRSLYIPAWILAVLVITLSGCRSIDLPKGSSKGYTSYRFMKTSAHSDDRFAQPSAERDRIAQAAIREELDSAGLKYDADKAELIVAYLFIQQDSVSTRVIPTYYGINYDKIQSYAHKKGVSESDRREYFDAGAIVVDVIEADSGKLIYRDFATRELNDINNASANASLIWEGVKESLADFIGK